jgi:hypothetical protein
MIAPSFPVRGVVGQTIDSCIIAACGAYIPFTIFCTESIRHEQIKSKEPCFIIKLAVLN